MHSTTSLTHSLSHYQPSAGITFLLPSFVIGTIKGNLKRRRRRLLCPLSAVNSRTTHGNLIILCRDESDVFGCCGRGEEAKGCDDNPASFRAVTTRIRTQKSMPMQHHPDKATTIDRERLMGGRERRGGGRTRSFPERQSFKGGTGNRVTLATRACLCWRARSISEKSGCRGGGKVDR